MDSQELDRIRFVSRHFKDLQGLRFGLPEGLAFVGVSLVVFLFDRSPLKERNADGSLFCLSCLFVLGCCVALSWIMWSYYRSRFGEVKGVRSDFSSFVGLLCRLFCIGATVYCLAALEYKLVSEMTCVGLLLILLGIRTWGLQRKDRSIQQRFRFIFGLLLVVMAPIVGKPDNYLQLFVAPDPGGAYFRYVDAWIAAPYSTPSPPSEPWVWPIAGFGLIVCGLLDHRQLVRAMKGQRVVFGPVEETPQLLEQR